jgi:hypothetical protein
MSLSLLITINVLADTALLAGLAYVMSRATRLDPHVASIDATRSPAAEQPLAQQRRPRSARSSRPEVTRPRAPMAKQAGSHAAVAHES